MITHLVPAFVAVLTLGCGPDDVCPGGSTKSGDHCLLVPADATFPELGAGETSPLGDSVTIDTEQEDTASEQDSTSPPDGEDGQGTPEPQDVGTPPDAAQDAATGGIDSGPDL